MTRPNCCCKINYANPGAFLRTVPGISTFTVPNGVFEINVWVIGGGGGGNQGYVAGGANGAGSGGGAGGTAYRKITVTPGQTFTFSVGAGGAAAVNGANTQAVFGAFTLIGIGGARGFNNGGATAGGAGIGGSFNITGGSGGAGSANNDGGASGGSINGVNGLSGNLGDGCGGFGTQAADFQGMRAALAYVVPVVTILGIASPGCFGNPQVDGAPGPSFGSSGSGTSGGPNSFGGAGNIGAGGGGSAANNSLSNVGGAGGNGAVLISWYT